MEVDLSVTIAAGCKDFFGKSLLNGIFFATSLLLVLAGLARAQSYPEFDGVYFKMNDGTFVELAEVGKVQPLGRAFLPSENWLNQPEGLWQADQFMNAPAIDPESAQSIVIVGRGFRDLRWTPFNSFNERYKNFIPDPRLPTKFDDYDRNIRESTDVNLLLDGNYIYRGNCGLDETSVKVRRVSDFVTELLPDGYRWPSAQNFSTASLRDRGCIWQPIPAQVVEVVVDGKFYAFRPKAAQVASAMQNGDGEGGSQISDGQTTQTKKLPFANGAYTWADLYCTNGQVDAPIGADINPVIISDSKVDFSDAICEIIDVSPSGDMLNVRLDCSLDGQRLSWEWSLLPSSEWSFEGRLNGGSANEFAFCGPV